MCKKIEELDIKIKEQVNETMAEIEKYLNKKNVEIKSIKRSGKTSKDEEELIEIIGSFSSRNLDNNKIIQDIIAIENVTSVTISED